MFEEKTCPAGESFGDFGLRSVHHHHHGGGDPENNKRILVASSRHLRNDSRSIQLEGGRYDGQAVSVAGESGGKIFKKSHIRSSSCDVRIIRSNSKEYENDCKLLKLPKKCHSRQSSKDMEQEFRKKFGHSRTNSDHLNIKYIINYLKSTPRDEKLNEDDDESLNGGGLRGRRSEHSRNHSYDQIYLGQNNNSGILDHGELNQRLCSLMHKDSADKNNCTNNLARNNLDQKYAEVDDLTTETKFTHSRNNSKDFNAKAEDSSHLRHRRTNSKDLNYRVSPAVVLEHLIPSESQAKLLKNVPDAV